MTRRHLIFLFACAAKAQRPSLSPATFPWAVDREGVIRRRIVPKPRSDGAIEPAIDLMPLHLALGSYLYQPENPMSIAAVRHHLALVQAATADETHAPPWREIHEFATILRNADQWHPLFD
jgi:hypothetical protein